MVDFVTERDRREALHVVRLFVAEAVERRHFDTIRSFHVAVVAGNRKTAFLPNLTALAFDDDGVDKFVLIAVLDVDDRDTS